MSEITSDLLRDLSTALDEAAAVMEDVADRRGDAVLKEEARALFDRSEDFAEEADAAEEAEADDADED